MMFYSDHYGSYEFYISPEPDQSDLNFLDFEAGLALESFAKSASLHRRAKDYDIRKELFFQKTHYKGLYQYLVDAQREISRRMEQRAAIAAAKGE